MSYKLGIFLINEDSLVRNEWDLLLLSSEEALIVRESEITRNVTASLWRKQIAGAKEHGYVMQPGDKLDAIQNAFEEALDLAQYLMKELQERES